ncbi:uncharacterized protein LOC123532013 [Mercenaria mercenaria]|uniref:uncharacterized protein LOC123532013 n=1 Tax=Mercenaria mercenaria TaxID=6596 RepID=UPI00234E5606|nr:uncharacterized protein LOC123532013 [Mercenaria mercenaria]
MDTGTERNVNPSAADVKPGSTMNQSHVDFSRLYGDLCRKLLSTPVGEIFPEVARSTTNHVTSATGSTSPSSIHPAFPSFSTMSPTQLSYLSNIYNPNGLLMAPVGVQLGLPTQEALRSDHVNHPLGGATVGKGISDVINNPSLSPGSEESIENMESIDVQKLVDEFRLTLERYGVSQRFAARFIMQDTSQGNLSFLMEKGRNKKWEELSPRGRLPYIKMKAWLGSKEHQMMTLDMLKHTQESRKNSARESYNRRERFTMFQLNVLCRLFEENSNPPMNIRNSVATRLGIPLDRVNVWFQNQRARGFPARKILQQTIYDNGSDPYLAIDVENMKDKINEANFIPQALQGNMDSPPHWKNAEQERNKKASLKMSSISASSIHTGTLVKSEPGDTAFPLDLSSTSNLDTSGRSEAYSPETVLPHTGERYLDSKQNDVLNDFEMTRTSANQFASQINYSAKSATSGAAKRKRGAKPQQILSLSKNEITKDTNCNSTHENKRRKLSDMSTPESNYTYLLDTSDILNENQHPNGDISRDYDYVIKSETSQNDEITKQGQVNDGSCAKFPKLEQMMSSEKTQNKFESDQINTHIRGTLPEMEKQEKVNRIDFSVSKTETMSPKSVELFKAMCASLAFTEGNKKEVDLNEPELD